MATNTKTNRASSPRIKIQDVPDVPTIGTAVEGEEEATVAFTPAVTGGPASVFRATSTPGDIESTGKLSPIVVSGLTAGTSYTFKVRAEGQGAVTPYSSSSNSVTPTAIPLSATGGTESVSGDYKYHLFASSGTLSVTGSGTLEVMVVSGGAGGGGAPGGRPTYGHGGGGGGSIVETLSVSAGDIAVVVGGAGSQSYFGATTVTAGSGQTAGLNGGTGGGTARTSVNPGSPGNDLSTLGWAVGPTRPGGGGGGGSDNGGGGAFEGGGQGSGGNNGAYASAGSANTGGGGGGGVRGNYGYDRNPAGGGSGVVVVRYVV